MINFVYGSQNFRKMEGLIEFVLKFFVKDSVINLLELLGFLFCKVEEEYEFLLEFIDLRI